MASQDSLQYFDICGHGQYETSFEDLFYPLPSRFLIAYIIKAIQDLKKYWKLWSRALLSIDMFTYVWFIDSWSDLLLPFRTCIFHSKFVTSEGQIESRNTDLRSSDLIREMWQHVSSIECRKSHFYLPEKFEELSLNLPRFCCRIHCSKFVVLCLHKRRVVKLHLCGGKKREGKAEERCQAQNYLFKLTIVIVLHQDS